MNRWQITYSGCFVLFFSCLAMATREIRQRSDGCGRNPLITLAAALGTGTSNLNEVLRAVKANPTMWAEMRDLLRRYDDCIRAGDGVHFKRSGVFPPEYTLSPDLQGPDDFKTLLDI